MPNDSTLPINFKALVDTLVREQLQLATRAKAAGNPANEIGYRHAARTLRALMFRYSNLPQQPQQRTSGPAAASRAVRWITTPRHVSQSALDGLSASLAGAA